MAYMVELERLLRPAGSNLLRFPNDRRSRDRVPIQVPCTELVGERMHRALSANLSPTGLYVDRVFGAGLERLQLGREDRRVQLEFELPATNESIWALGEICHDDVSNARGRATVHGTGVHFLTMARKHERLIEDFVYEHRRRRLEVLLERVTNRRRGDRRRRDRRAA
jgi:hypothetical protein